MSNIEMCIYNSNHKSIAYQNDKDITVKTSTFLQIMGVISRTLKFFQIQKHTRMKIYNALLLPTLQYGCETWAIRGEDKSRIMSAEKKFVKRSAQGRIRKSMKMFCQNSKLTQL